MWESEKDMSQENQVFASSSGEQIDQGGSLEQISECTRFFAEDPLSSTHHLPCPMTNTGGENMNTGWSNTVHFREMLNDF